MQDHTDSVPRLQHLNRRQLLGATGAALIAGPWVGHALGEQLQGINIGFIGVGGRGTVLLREMLTLLGARVTAVCDIDPEHMERARKLIVGAGQPEPFTTAQWKRLLDRNDVDAVVSALPTDLHMSNYLDVLAAGKDLYGEKPLSLTLEQCDRVVKTSEASDRIVQIGYQRRADPRYSESMKLVHAGELGDLVEGRIIWSNAWGPLFGWKGQARRSGDWMLELIVHNLDVMNWAHNALPASAIGMGRNDLFRDRQPERDVTDYFNASLQYPGGATVSVIVSWVSTKTYDTKFERLFGTRGAVDFEAGWISYNKKLNKPNRKAFTYEGVINSTGMALQSFLESVRHRTEPIATVQHGRDGVAAGLLVAEAVRRRSLVQMSDIV
jgi:predicted dehydrogenase